MPMSSPLLEVPSEHDFERIRSDADDSTSSGDDEIDVNQLSEWRVAVQKFFFPRAHRKALKKQHGNFEQLDKRPDWFEYLSLVAIALNMVALAADDPTDTHKTSARSKALIAADLIFMGFFVIELILRLVAFGVVEFMRHKWNILDTFVVVSGLVAISLQSAEFESLSGIRAIRVLRPLRTVTKFPSVKLVVNAMLRSLKDLVDVSILYLLFLFSFSAAGIAQFSRRLRLRCVRDDFFDNHTQWSRQHQIYDVNFTVAEFVCGGYVDELLGNTSIGCSPKQGCDDTTSHFLRGYYCPYGYRCYQVHNPFYGFVGFDNIAQASLTLQSVISLELFPDVLYRTMDAVDITSGMFCVAVVIFGTFFIVNLLVALITVEFQKCQEEGKHKDENVDATKRRRRVRAKPKLQAALDVWQSFVQSQRSVHSRWQQQHSFEASTELTASLDVEMADRRSSVEDYESNVESEPTSVEPPVVPLTGVEKVRAFVHTKILQSPIFIWSSTILIVLGVLIMATEYHGMPSHVIEAYDHVTLAFTILITIDMLIRFIGTTPFLFILDVGNITGIIVVVVSWVDYALEDFRLPAIRSLRIVIAIKLVQQFPNIYKWFLIMLKAFRASMVLLFIMFLDIFIFACLGMQLFGGKFCGLDPNGVNGWCDDRPRLNFDTFGDALLTSFQLMTGSDWNLVMYNGMRAAGEGYALLFVAHHFIAVYILVNLFIAILIDASDTFDEKVEMAHLLPALPDGADEQGMESTAEDAIDILDQPALDGLVPQLQKLLSNRVFDTLMILVIIVSTVTLAVTDPLSPPDTTKAKSVHQIGTVCTSIFIMECILNVLAYGFVMTPTTYLRRTKWNILDFLLVICGIVDLILSNLNVSSAVQSAKILYALRPLRVLRRSPGVQVVTKSLGTALPAIKDVLIVALIFWTCFAIAGVQLFKGEFYSCSEPEYTTKQNCTSSGHRWVNKPLHFDHFGAAMISLFVISTFEGWSPVMHSGIDAVGPDESPRLNNNPMAALYFVIFAVLGGFFLVNLFISVLINTYEQEKKRLQKKSMFLTDEQQEWLGCQKRLFSVIPIKEFLRVPRDVEVSRLPKVERQRLFWLSVVTDPTFELCIFIVIALNAVVAAIEYYPMPQKLGTTLSMINLVLTLVFVFEAAVKIFAMRSRLYFSSHWNRFDFAVVIVSVVGAVMELALSQRSSFGSVFRTLRVVRLIRLLKGKRRLAEMTKRFIIALYALNNVAALVVLFITLFALLCLRLFGRLRRDGEVITHNANFENYANSALTLFRVITGGAWPDIMAACRAEPPDCDANIGDCGSPVAAPFVFISFFLFGTYVLLNIFVAVIMDSFEGIDENNDDRFLNQKDAEEFVRNWLHFDETRTLQIACGDVLPLLKQLPIGHPFRFSKEVEPGFERFSELSQLIRLQLTSINLKIEFFDMVQALSREHFDVIVSSSATDAIRKKFNRRFAFRKRLSEKQAISTKCFLHEWYAAKLMWEAWLRYKEIHGLGRDSRNAPGPRLVEEKSTAASVLFLGQHVKPANDHHLNVRALIELEDYIYRLEEAKKGRGALHGKRSPFDGLEQDEDDATGWSGPWRGQPIGDVEGETLAQVESKMNVDDDVVVREVERDPYEVLEVEMGPQPADRALVVPEPVGQYVVLQERNWGENPTLLREFSEHLLPEQKRPNVENLDDLL